MNNIKINVHGLITIIMVALLLVLTLVRVLMSSGEVGQQLLLAVYGIIAISVYVLFIFKTIRERESLFEDRRRIVSEKVRLEIFRTLVGWHLAAALSLLALLIPFNALSFTWLVVSVIAGLGIPRIVLQQSDG